VTLQAISKKVAGRILIDRLILYITCQEILGWFSFGWQSCHRSYYMLELLLVVLMTALGTLQGVHL
jgi:hypothetical protein